MPKQFQTLLGIPLLWWSVRAFHREDPSAEITVVLHPGFFDWWDIMVGDLPAADRAIPVRLVAGGKDRPHSVANGIHGIESGEDVYIAVHDGARPVVSVDLIRRGWEAAAEHRAVFPACPVTDSLREKNPDGDGSRPVDRSRFMAVQTPQVFRADILKSTYVQAEGIGSFTDDASLVEACGVRTMAYPGDPANMKVTNPMDFKVAETLLEATGISRGTD